MTLEKVAEHPPIKIKKVAVGDVKVPALPIILRVIESRSGTVTASQPLSRRRRLTFLRKETGSDRCSSTSKAVIAS
jgi:hypothetical protein